MKTSGEDLEYLGTSTERETEITCDSVYDLNALGGFTLSTWSTGSGRLTPIAVLPEATLFGLG